MVDTFIYNDIEYPFYYTIYVISQFEKQSGIKYTQIDDDLSLENLMLLYYLAVKNGYRVSKQENPLNTIEDFIDIFENKFRELTELMVKQTPSAMGIQEPESKPNSVKKKKA